MAEEKTMRLKQVATTLNISLSTVVDYLSAKGFDIENKPTTKITPEQYNVLAKEFASSMQAKLEAAELNINIGKKHGGSSGDTDVLERGHHREPEQEMLIKNSPFASKTAPVEPPKPAEPAPKEEPATATTTGVRLQGLKVLDKIDLSGKRPAVAAPEKKEAPAMEATAVEAPAPEAPAAEKAAPAPEESRPQAVESPVAEPAPAPKEAEPVAQTPVTPPVEQPATFAQSPAAPAPREATAPVEETKTAPVAESRPAAAAPQEQFPVTAPAQNEPEEQKTITAKADPLKGLTVLGKIELPADASRKKGSKPVASSDDKNKKNKKKRKRIIMPNAGPDTSDRPIVTRGERKDLSQQRPSLGRPGGKGFVAAPRADKAEVSDKQIQDQIKATLARLSGGKASSQGNRAKYRREKRSAVADATEQQRMQEQAESRILRVTEFISANDLSSLMDVSVNEVIKVCLNLGMFVSINQRLDAEAITIISDEFGYDVEFISTEEEEILDADYEDAEEDLQDRAPIVTIMGHVDHGKTSLLDYIRNSKVTAGEAGGITQHIGAYDVKTDTGKRITFLDTPGHEAFTAMRARGAKVTDVVIIVVAADDNVMPQTKEALNHAQAAGVPIVIAINKVDKPTANPEKIKEELAQINVLVEDWGGKYQSQEISAKTGQGVADLLEKVLLESELLELKANPDRNASGTVIEASLDKGRGYVATVLVQTGSLKIGDIMLAGSHYGRVKAMTDHRGKKIKNAGPSTPIQVLGLDGAPQAGDKFIVLETEREAREVASHRTQLIREQSMRTKKHITLDEIGRRLAIGSFKELNVIVKGDVDGSVEALSDSLLKLSTNEVQVNILSKGVGQISESDVLLASASDAIIIGFQVRPSQNARKLAEQAHIDIRLYSIIYNAINELKDAMEGMLAPTVQEVITGNAQVREVFNITKVGTIAGCMVTDGTIHRNNNIRLVRDGIVVFSGQVQALKRFKDDVAEVRTGFECGISIKNFTDIQEGDVIEAYEEKEVKRTL
jgi:translation initiation factor IF-2